ncbi:MAG TPA: STAS domain-containing protein [Holophagaceae bacterium]|nr:STAS domain-containing protein [Holophagaceae bacterium]
MAGKSPKPTVVTLTGDLDIFSIQAQGAALKEALKGAGPCVVDLAGVGDVDLSGIQLLVSAAGGRGDGGFRLQGLSPELGERMKELGLQAFLAEVAP